ncbi:FecR family protein [Pedobacter sp. SL55]|uniref:FecR family protein n=1 Tax=Pedobacter sp. SL55 TaxID=2995161 RepID=UPI0022709642|nr:FecR family protein [Pedobacter sp. SL55]WAC42474.1 FecR family protein [Pedobacter sp. SL55]
MEKERILHLYKAYQLQTATKEEELEFAKLLHDEQYEEIFNEILDENWTEITAQQLQNAEFAGHATVLDNLKSQLTATANRRKLWPSITAAAILLAVLGIGFFWISNKKAEEIHFANDIAPGKNGATLTLANGRKILINDAIAGNIANETGVKISKNKDGQIVYEVVGNQTGALVYNTLTTTRGEQTQIRLPDGTTVFLNAESSLRFPTSFANTAKRKVSLTGEGYFEVSKDKNHPFVVESNQQEVEVWHLI